MSIKREIYIPDNAITGPIVKIIVELLKETVVCLENADKPLDLERIK
jgi:hypothetical protein